MSARLQVTFQAVQRLACSCEGARRCSRRRRPAVPSGQELLSWPRTQRLRALVHSWPQPIIRRRRGARATRRPSLAARAARAPRPLPEPRRRVVRRRRRRRASRRRRAAPSALRRKDIAAPRSAAADGGRPKVRSCTPLWAAAGAASFAFLRGFFAGRRDDGAAGAGASSGQRRRRA